MTELDNLRSRILEIDEEMLALWKERDDAAARIGAIKHTQGLPLQNFEVEKAVLEHAIKTGIGLGLNTDRVRTLVRMLIESAVTVQEREHVKRSARGGRRALIIGGAGLMGGWFSRFLEGQGYQVFVDDPRPSNYPLPPKDADLDLILVATPPSTVPDVLPKAAARAGPKTLVADIASIKGDSVKILRQLASSGAKVASIHPMFGPSAEVLIGRNVVVMDCGNRDAVKHARSLFDTTTVKIHEMPVEEHDEFMAELLGLSHATSLAFNETLARGKIPFSKLEPLSSTTFRKQVDVSREVARENPRLYFEIQKLNPETSQIFDRMEEAVAELRKMVAARNPERFIRFMKRGLAYYEEGVPRSK
ncbi:MAG TPA: prephenate dehydrogenase/arogenate dehydrogenase family protein [Candidatus Thermoplasmatota archaeon]